MELKVPVQKLDYATSDYIPPEIHDGFWERINLVAEVIGSIRARRLGTGNHRRSVGGM